MGRLQLLRWSIGGNCMSLMCAFLIRLVPADLLTTAMQSRTPDGKELVSLDDLRQGKAGEARTCPLPLLRCAAWLRSRMVCLLMGSCLPRNLQTSVCCSSFFFLRSSSPATRSRLRTWSRTASSLEFPLSGVFSPLSAGGVAWSRRRRGGGDMASSVVVRRIDRGASA